MGHFFERQFSGVLTPSTKLKEKRPVRVLVMRFKAVLTILTRLSTAPWVEGLSAAPMYHHIPNPCDILSKILK